MIIKECPPDWATAEIKKIYCVVVQLEKKHCGDFFIFSRNFDLNYPKFYKRVKVLNDEDVLIIVCEKSEFNKDRFQHFNFKKIEEISFFSKPLLTQKQLNEENKFWPLSQTKPLWIPEEIEAEEYKEIIEKIPKELELNVCSDTCIITKNNKILAFKTVDKKRRLRTEHSCLRAINKVAKDLQKEKNDFNHYGRLKMKEDAIGDYVCTNCYVYLSSECCIMCSMAFVHSRVNRIFLPFNSRNAVFGGLGGKIDLKSHPNLNHSYKLFYIF